MKHATIVADPPWPIAWSTPATRVNGRGERHVNHKRSLGYPTMSVDEIAGLHVDGVRVADLGAEDAHLYLWTTEAFLMSGEAVRVALSWRFVPQRTLIWRKSGFGLGSFPRPQHETCLICTRGRLPFRVNNVGSVQDWKLVYEGGARKHSAKPDGFYDLVETASPGPYLEFFARRRRLGWDAWGNEVESDAVAA